MAFSNDLFQNQQQLYNDQDSDFHSEDDDSFSQYSNTDSDTDPDTDFEVRNEHCATTNDQCENATTLISTCPQPPTVLYAAILVPSAINTFQIFLAVIIFS